MQGRKQIMKNSVGYSFNSDKKLVGGSIKRIILDKELTVEYCAKEIGVSKKHLSSFLNDKSWMQRSKIYRLCWLLGIEAEDYV